MYKSLKIISSAIMVIAICTSSFSAPNNFHFLHKVASINGIRLGKSTNNVDNMERGNNNVELKNFNGNYEIATPIILTGSPTPIIKSFSPTNASTGTTDTIKGSGFTGTTAVSFGGITASSFIVKNDSTILAVVGNGASGSVMVTNANGSVSLAGFKLCISSSSNTNITICQGSSYTFNGQTYTTSGTYISHLTNSTGCDSAATLILSVKTASTSTTNASMNTGGTYLFNGINFTTAGTYTAHLMSSAGCDSIAKLILTINPITSGSCNGLSNIGLASSNQCISSKPVLKVSGAKFAAKIEWYNGTTLVATNNIKTDNTIGKTVAGDSSGTSGLDLSHFDKPWGIVVDPIDDSVYVSDYTNHRVMKWKNGVGTVFSGVAGIHSQNPGYFYHPTGLFLSSTGSLYVSDYDNHKVQKFVKGSKTSVFVAGNSASGGTTSNITTPFGVFADKDSNVYVSDAFGGGPISGFAQNPTWGSRISKWAPSANVGTIVAGKLGDAGGNGAGQLYYPTGVYVKSNGDIYIADFGNSRIQKWTKGATQGVTVADLSTIGTGNSAVFPTDVWVDENTNTIYITASNQIVDFEYLQYAGVDNYVLQWGAEGTKNFTILNQGTSTGNKLHTPSSLYVTPNASIYVVDRGNNRAQAWTKSIDTTFTPTVAGSYTAKVYSTGGCSETSNIVLVDTTYSAAVTVTANPSGSICSGTNVTFTASPKNGTVLPSYQWTKGGLNITGATNSNYTYSPSNGDNIACIMTANNVCKSITTATSNTIIETLIVNNPPIVSIASAVVNNTFCASSAATFTATPTNGGTNPTYQWMVNGMNAGINSNVFTTTTLNEKDVITCELIRVSAGCTNAPVTSSPITVSIINNVSPTISITSSNTTICSGTSVTFNSTISNGGATPLYQWTKGGANITGATNPSYTYSPSNGDVIACVLTPSNTCQTTNNLKSNSITETVGNSTSSTTAVGICIGSSYSFNGSSYSSAGTYIAHLTNAAGCDSAATLELSIKSPSTSTTKASICTGNSYTFNGSSYSSAGTYVAHLTNAAGCDSSATLVLTIKSLSTSTTNASICAGSSYTFNGTTYSSAGTYVAHLTNAAGCDSAATLVLTIKSLSTSTTNASICTGSSYTFNGTIYSSAGTYVAHLTNAAGCDSAATLVLTIKALSTSTTNASICAGSSYTFNGTTYTLAGTYVAHLTNTAGCDSAATLILTVKSVSSSTTNASICAGSSYTFNGTTYTLAGTYVAHLTNAAGCDSAATLLLSITPLPIITTQPISPACGIATVDLSNAVTSGFTGTLYYFTDAALIVPIPNMVSNAGTYYIKVSSNGCTNSASVLVNAFKRNPVFSTIPIDPNCGVTSFDLRAAIVGDISGLTLSFFKDANYSIFQSNNVTTAGTYYVMAKNSDGCIGTSLNPIVVNAFRAATSSLTNKSVCPSALPYIWNGNNYSSAGTYIVHLSNSVGCDSAASLHLTVNSISRDTIRISTGVAYTWHGTTYTQSGTYTFDTLNSVGCDSLTVLILNSTLPISIKDFVATSAADKVILNWSSAIELNTAKFIIQVSSDGSSFTNIGTENAIGNGANSYQYSDNNPQNGINYYRLKSIDKDGTFTYSKIVSALISTTTAQISVYPNPVANILTIKGNHINTVQVIDNMGRVVKFISLKDKTNPSISVESIEKGMYHLRLQNTDGKTNTVGFVKQ